MALKLRDTLVGQRTQLINLLRGHAAEFGVIAGKGTGKVTALLTAIAADPSIPSVAKEMLALLGEQIEHLDGKIAVREVELTAMHKRPKTCRPDAGNHEPGNRDAGNRACAASTCTAFGAGGRAPPPACG
jgi:transposase